MPVLEKRTVSIEELDAMAAVELPDREMLSLVTILITNVLNNLSVTVTVKNVNIAAQVCAVVGVLNTNVGTSLTCTVGQ
jgi:hypothetical protein